MGARLVREIPGEPTRIGRIVEVEAYIGEDDRASHARFGRTDRNAVMYGPPGIAYVYLVYGMYDCLNVVTEAVGFPAAVLIRAVEPIVGIDAMRRGRVDHALARRRPDGGTATQPSPRIATADLTRLADGPGKLAAAFAIGREQNGVDLCESSAGLWIEPAADDDRPVVVRATPRIGIGYAGAPWTDVPWRLIDAASPVTARARR